MASPVGAPKVRPQAGGRQSGVPRVGRQNSVPRVGRPEVVWMVWRLHTSLKYGVAGVFYGLATPGL